MFLASSCYLGGIIRRGKAIAENLWRIIQKFDSLLASLRNRLVCRIDSGFRLG